MDQNHPPFLAARCLPAWSMAGRRAPARERGGDTQQVARQAPGDRRPDRAAGGADWADTALNGRDRSIAVITAASPL
jgi:hypothetical protein